MQISKANNLQQRQPLEVFKAVVLALCLREIRTRFGPYKLGYAWAILEPLMHVVILTAIFSTRVEKFMPGVDFPVFIATGIIPWLLFSNIATRSINALEANLGLFAYRQVQPIDPLVARTILESVIHICTFAAIMSGLLFFGHSADFHDPLRVLLGVGLFAVFTSAVGLIFMMAGHFSAESQKLLPIIIRPLYFVSGIFFSPIVLPEQYKDLLFLNPILQGIEIIRSGIFADYPHSGYSISYFLSVTVATLVAACYLYEAKKKELRSQ